VSVLLLSTDLMVVSKLQAAARDRDLACQAVSNPEQLFSTVESNATELVIVDLSVAGLDVAAVIGRLKQMSTSPGKVLAFGPHVHEAKLQAAAQAGADSVLSRGQFHADIDRLLSEIA